MTSRGVAVAVQKLSYWPQSKKKRGSRPIIEDVNFLARPGRLVGVLGPSGGGKTTLLNALAHRIRRGTIEGQIDYIVSNEGNSKENIEGQPTTEGYANQRLVSYVMAQDRFLPGLTIEETLQYAARLKLPALTNQERAERVEQVMHEVQLFDVRGSQIRSDQKLPLGDSKRLSLAVELLDQSPVLILDEPTSGLDTSLSSDIINELRRLAQTGNRTIICSIHQPRTSVFNCFDDVILLSAGRVVYYGPPIAISAYFETELGVKCPPLWSPADFALEVVANSSSAIQPTQETSLSDAAVITEPTEEVMKNRRPIKQYWSADALAEAYSRSQLGQTHANELSMAREQPIKLKPRTHKQIGLSGWFDQTWVLTKRQFLSQRRDMLACWLLLVINIIQGLVIGSIFWQMPDYVDGFQPIQLADVTQEVIPWGSSWFDSLIYGVDDHGYQPVFETVDYGVNGYGRGLVDTLILDETLQQNVKELTTLLYDHFNVSVQYPSLDWLDEVIGTTTSTVSTKKRLESLEDEGGPIGENSTDVNPVIAKYMKLGLQGLHLLDFTYYKYDWSQLAFCDNILTMEDHTETSRNAAYYICLVVQANDLANMMIVDFLRWKYPNTVLSVISLSFCDKFPCAEWLKDGKVTLPRRLSSSDFSFSFSWDDFMNLDENKVMELSDQYGITPWLAENVGTEPLKLLKPIQEYAQRIANCVHPLCDTLKSVGQGFLKTSDRLQQFISNSYTTLGTMFNISGVVFFISLFLGFSAYDVLFTFPKQRALFNKETANGLYHPSTYYIAKTVADIPFQTIPSLVLSIILYFMVGLHRIGDQPIQQFIVYLVICILISFAAYGFGYMISAAAPRLEIAMLMAPIFLMIWLCIAGFFLRDSDLPTFITWFKYVSFYRWGFFGLTANTFRQGSYFGNLPNELNFALSGITETRIWFSCVMLILVNLLYRIIGFFCLKYLNRKVGLES